MPLNKKPKVRRITLRVSPALYRQFEAERKKAASPDGKPISQGEFVNRMLALWVRPEPVPAEDPVPQLWPDDGSKVETPEEANCVRVLFWSAVVIAAIVLLVWWFFS